MSDKDISLANDFKVIGYPDEIKEVLLGEYSCFGKMYKADHPECISCRAPVVVNSRVVPLKKYCASICQNKALANIRRLGSSDIEFFLDREFSVEEIFEKIAGDNPTEAQAREARALIYQRFYYLKKNKGYEPPDIPPVKELIS